MSECTALTRLDPLKPLNPDALPRYFLEKLTTRSKARSDARVTAVGEGMSAAFYAFLTCVFGYLTILIWSCAAPIVPLAIVTAFLSGASLFAAVPTGWKCLERIEFLRGTRDETKYLPANCRVFAEAEASLAAAFSDVDAAAARWNASLPLLEEHGTPGLRATAAANREKLETRRQAVVSETARLWTLAARSESPPADS